MEKIDGAVGRALIVEDDDDSRFFVGRLLEMRLHCIVVLASSAEEALKLYDAEKFDIIISDYHMPNRTGADLARELSRRKCTIPFLIYSAENISRRELENLDLITDVVLKPNMEDLFSIVSMTMGWPLDPPGWS